MTETKGYFGQFGGSFVPEPIQNLLNQLEETFEQYKNEIEESYVYDFLMNLFIKFPFLKIGEYMNQNQEGQEYRAATSFIEEKIKKDKIDLEKMREIMDSLEEIKDWDTDDVIFKWIDNLELEEEEKEIQ